MLLKLFFLFRDQDAKLNGEKPDKRAKLSSNDKGIAQDLIIFMDIG